MAVLRDVALDRSEWPSRQLRYFYPCYSQLTDYLTSIIRMVMTRWWILFPCHVSFESIATIEELADVSANILFKHESASRMLVHERSEVDHHIV